MALLVRGTGGHAREVRTCDRLLDPRLCRKSLGDGDGRALDVAQVGVDRDGDVLADALHELQAVPPAIVELDDVEEECEELEREEDGEEVDAEPGAQAQASRHRSVSLALSRRR